MRLGTLFDITKSRFKNKKGTAGFYCIIWGLFKKSSRTLIILFYSSLFSKLSRGGVCSGFLHCHCRFVLLWRHLLLLEDTSGCDLALYKLKLIDWVDWKLLPRLLPETQRLLCDISLLPPIHPSLTTGRQVLPSRAAIPPQARWH